MTTKKVSKNTSKYKIIDNALPGDYFNKLKNTIMSDSFPWFYCDSVAYKNEDDGDYYFVHGIYHEQKPWSDFYLDFESLVSGELCSMASKALNIKSLIRAKVNFYPKTNEIRYHNQHIDEVYKHKGAILYINDNNGFTVLEDGTKIESVSNRILLFDPSKPHNSTTCTDAKCRVNININYF